MSQLINQTYMLEYEKMYNVGIQKNEYKMAIMESNKISFKYNIF